MAFDPKDLTFDDRGLLPVAIQDADTNEVLLVGFANEEAVRTTFERKLATERTPFPDTHQEDK